MKRFGLLGYSLGYSFSKKYFTEKFSREGLDDFVYDNFEIPSIDLLPELLSTDPAILGLNVTIPYKEQVIPYLDDYDETVASVKACNCIKINGGKLTGYNTDVYGFKRSLQTKLQPIHRKALILGTGGASKAVEFSLQKLKIDFTIVSRTAEGSNVINYNDITPEVIDEYLLIINTTPLGTFPNINEAPLLPYGLLTSNHFLFDLVYNPQKSKFLLQGEARGATIQNGHDMLINQAEESWRIWNTTK